MACFYGDRAEVRDTGGCHRLHLVMRVIHSLSASNQADEFSKQTSIRIAVALSERELRRV